MENLDDLSTEKMEVSEGELIDEQKRLVKSMHRWSLAGIGFSLLALGSGLAMIAYNDQSTTPQAEKPGYVAPTKVETEYQYPYEDGRPETLKKVPDEY